MTSYLWAIPNGTIFVFEEKRYIKLHGGRHRGIFKVYCFDDRKSYHLQDPYEARVLPASGGSTHNALADSRSSSTLRL